MRPRGSRLKTSIGPTLRDLAGEIEWAKAVLASAGKTYAVPRRAPPAARQTTVRRPTSMAKVYAALRGQGKQRSRRARLRRPAAGASPRAHRAARRMSPSPGSRSVPARSWSTSTRTSHPCSTDCCSTHGSVTVRDLCVVGDANQTIYSFAGATPGVFARLPEARLPGGDRAGASAIATTAPHRRSSSSRTVLVKAGAGRPGSGPAGAAAAAGVALIGQRPRRPGANVRGVRRRARRGC